MSETKSVSESAAKAQGTANKRSRVLINSSDIAIMAQVSNGAVSNWRKRDERFPQPVEGSKGKPLFDYDEVVAWLASAGKVFTERRFQQQLWTLRESLGDALSPDSATNLIVASLCLKKAAEVFGLGREWAALQAGSQESAINAVSQYVQAVKDADNKQERGPKLTHVLEEWEHLLSNIAPGEIVTVLDSVAECPDDKLAEFADGLLSKSIREAGRAGGEFGFVDSKVSRFIADLAVSGMAVKQQDSYEVYDPVCGISTITTQIAQVADNVSFHEADVNTWAVFIAEARFFLRFGVTVPLRVTQSDCLHHDSYPALKADVVVMEPPFNIQVDDMVSSDPRWRYGLSGRIEFGFGFLQDAIAHLNSNGRAYVATPGGTLSRLGREGDIRRCLIMSGCVEAIIVLPAKLLLNTGIPVFIWVLTTPASQRNVIYMIDCSRPAKTDQQPGLPTNLSNPSREFLDGNVAWKAVPVKDILADSDASLSPVKWLEPASVSASMIAKNSEALSVGIRQTLAKVADASFVLRNLPERLPDMDKLPTVTVQELISQGKAELLIGDCSDIRSSDLPEDAIRPEDVLDDLRRLTSVPQAKGPDGLGARTEPNDILISTLRGIHATLDAVGGHRVSRHVHVLRVVDKSWSPQYLALCVEGMWNTAAQQSPAVRVRPSQMLIPVADAATQHDILRVAEAKKAASLLERLTAEYLENYRNALRYGSDSKTSDTVEAGNGVGKEQA
ncbi:N-6 DNA methylase [Bifidobacterium oedipodis]|uniref:N-6 DNA Methylase n=1 Tax=Bifidobacterium oedipodis TaxID=2675322 RepID=A0A7Y0EMR2_9BIFI|nr:N-6 DNA methylase [Bifidobacterium sp. DSM 109957]NMM93114.1 N-6 DNA Methylase [Bifidobacterium sp. DSM 109957]